MLNVLKKVGELRRDVGGGKSNGLKPPKNLPDLARDIYEHDEQKSTNSDSSISNDTTSNYDNNRAIINAAQNTQYVPKSVSPSEPNKDSVPKLDLSLVRQHLAASQSAIQSIQPQPVQQTVTSQIAQQPVAAQAISQSNFTSPIPINTQFMNNQSVLQSSGANSDTAFINGTVDDSSGFFKELEEYVKNNGLNNEVIGDLLNKNLLDHMSYYHTTKGEDTPFYASSAEISHAIKLKLEDLQNLEHSWIANKQKVDLLKKINSSLESDIHLKSEELKKLMTESAKRGVVVKPADFFQIVKPKSYDFARTENLPVANTINLSSVSHAPVSNVSQSNTNVNIVAKPISFLQQPSVTQKFSLNKYITSDSSKYFYAKNGQVFKSLSDLMDGIETMDKETFNYHVNGTKNDFSNWLKGVFNDLRLSDAIRSLIDREKLWYYLKNNTSYM